MIVRRSLSYIYVFLAVLALLTGLWEARSSVDNVVEGAPTAAVEVSSDMWMEHLGNCRLEGAPSRFSGESAKADVEHWHDLKVPTPHPFIGVCVLNVLPQVPDPKPVSSSSTRDVPPPLPVSVSSTSDRPELSAETANLRSVVLMI